VAEVAALGSGEVSLKHRLLLMALLDRIFY